MTPLLPIDDITWIEAGRGVAARGRVPEQAEFFQDHFPVFPVLPGVLALEILKSTADAYLRTVEKSDECRYSLKHVRSVKFTNYLRPGDVWESRMELISGEDGKTQWQGKLFHGGQVAVSARLEFQAQWTQEHLVPLQD